MEVSSHALALKRVAHVTFQAGIFTNLTHEHLDFHKSMDDYLNAKLKLFDAVQDQPGRPAFAVLNCDDARFEKIKNQVRIPVISYGTGNGVDIRADNIRMDETKLHFDLVLGQERIEILSTLGGLFNVSNLLAAAATANRLGVSAADIQWVLERLPRVPGRFESIDCDQPFHVIVDFAHTPDGLEKLLTSVRDITEGKLITLFGCPGERDTEKRPMMGELAARMSDIVIVTTDDPHHEDPQKIIDDILPGVAAGGKLIGRDAYALVDRKEAIAMALSKASAGDSVVLAGRGHETVQDFAGQKIPLDDRAEAARLLAQK
jgi:UDP-N-acetylmuramoyl-L-alanyl-D-glutamate--2,6-diaminopimelate ligase